MSARPAVRPEPGQLRRFRPPGILAGLIAVWLTVGASPYAARAQGFEPPVIKKAILNEADAPFTAGETIVFEIAVANPLGGASGIYVRIGDAIDPNYAGLAAPTLRYDDTIGTCTYDFEPGGVGHRVSCTNAGGVPLDPGREWRIEIQVRVDPTACALGGVRGELPPYENAVSWQWWSDKLPVTEGEPASVRVDVEPPEPCDFRVSKAADASRAAPGDVVTFDVTVENVGNDYRLYGGFWPTSIIYDVVPSPLEVVGVESLSPDYGCDVAGPYDGTPPAGFAWLPSESGTLVWCLSPARDATWVFPKGAVARLRISARVPSDVNACEIGNLSNVARFAFGFTTFHGFAGLTSRASEPVQVELTGCGRDSDPIDPIDPDEPGDDDPPGDLEEPDAPGEPGSGDPEEPGGGEGLETHSGGASRSPQPTIAAADTYPLAWTGVAVVPLALLASTVTALGALLLRLARRPRRPFAR